MDSENSETPPIASSFALSTGRQRQGKVARLPKAVRDRINNMLFDGLSYSDILEKLGPDAHGVTEANLGIRCERHRTQEAERKAELARARSSPAKGGISDEALRQAEERLKLL